MDVFTRPINGGLKTYWRRQKYQRLHGGAGNRKRLQVTSLGGGSGSPRGSWKIRIIPKLRWKIAASSSKTLIKLKNAYINMMMNLAGNVGLLNTNKTFGGKHIPKARQVSTKYSREEFEDRVIIEIYKSLQSSQRKSNGCAYRPIGGGLKRYWRRRQYQRLHGGAGERKRLQATRLGGGRGGPRRSWKIRIIPKLRWKIVASPIKMLIKLKNAYINMMMNLAGNVGLLNTNKTFGGKSTPKARQVSTKYSQEEFENRLIVEIYKSLKASQVLGPK